MQQRHGQRRHARPHVGPEPAARGGERRVHVGAALLEAPRQPAQPYKRRRLRTAIVVAETAAAAAPAGDDTGSGSAADEAWARPAPTERLPRSEAAEGENPGEKHS